MREVRHWKWKAANSDGKVYSGSWEYADIGEVRKGLRNRGLYPLDIRPQTLFRITSKEGTCKKWFNFTKHLAVLLEAGVPLIQALDIMINRSPSRGNFSPQQIGLVKQRIQAGAELHEAVAVLQPLPDSFIRYRLRAGEHSGKVAEALEEIATMLERDLLFNRKLKSVLTYPIILLVMIIVVLTVLSIWLLPMYQGIFANLDGELPLLTQVIFSIGRLVPSGLLILGIGGTVGFVSTRYSPRIKLALQNGLRKLPLWGQLLRLADEEFLSRVLARFLSSGIPILDALNLMRDMHNNPLKGQVDALAYSVNEGQKLAPVLKMGGVFSPDKCELLRIGEESGKLEEALLLISKWARIELEEQMEQFSRVLEPILILVMAALIGTLAIGVLLPIMQASSQLKY